MRVTTAFNRMLGLDRTRVTAVRFDPAGVIVTVTPTWRSHRCPCGAIAGGYDHRTRRWRHLDAGGTRLWLEADLWRVDCRGCGRVRTEAVPWARPGARLTSDLELLIAWLAQRTDKTSICRLLRVAWETVHRVVTNVVADHLDEGRLDEVFNIGVDEISYKRGHQYLTVVADHDTGRVLHVGKGRGQQPLNEFFELMGPDRCRRVEAISMDMATIWRQPCADHIPQAAICFDPFHVIRWANQALETVYSGVARNQSGATISDWRKTRYALRAGAETLDADHHTLINRLRRERYGLWRAWELKERLRDLYRTTDPQLARAHLTTWYRSAIRSNLAPFKQLARRIKHHFDGIIAAVEHGLSNSRLEGINAKIRLINKRGHGHPNTSNLTAMIHLCLGGIELQPPTKT